MKTLVWIIGAGVLCVIAMVAMKKMEKVSVEALSCRIDDGTAKVAVEYANRSESAVTVDYDLVLMSGRRRAVGIVKMRHIAGVLIKPGEDRRETVTLAVAKSIRSASAGVEELAWQTAASH